MGFSLSDHGRPITGAIIDKENSGTYPRDGKPGSTYHTVYLQNPPSKCTIAGIQLDSPCAILHSETTIKRYLWLFTSEVPEEQYARVSIAKDSKATKKTFEEIAAAFRKILVDKRIDVGEPEVGEVAMTFTLSRGCKDPLGTIGKIFECWRGVCEAIARGEEPLGKIVPLQLKAPNAPSTLTAPESPHQEPAPQPKEVPSGRRTAASKYLRGDGPNLSGGGPGALER